MSWTKIVLSTHTRTCRQPLSLVRHWNIGKEFKKRQKTQFYMENGHFFSKGIFYWCHLFYQKLSVFEELSRNTELLPSIYTIEWILNATASDVVKRENTRMPLYWMCFRSVVDTRNWPYWLYEFNSMRDCISWIQAGLDVFANLTLVNFLMCDVW